MKIDRRRLRAAAPRHAGDHPPGLAVRRRQPLRRPAAPGGRRTSRRSPTAASSTRPTRRRRSTSTSSSTPSTPRRARRCSGVIRGFGDRLRGQGRGRPTRAWPTSTRRSRPPSRLFQRAQLRHAAARSASSSPARSSSPTSPTRRDDLAGLVDHLATTTGAIGRQKQRARRRDRRSCPPFMRRANTTFVNLRATLDDLDAARRRVQAGRQEAAPVPAPSCARWRATRGPTLRDLSRARSSRPAPTTTSSS